MIALSSSLRKDIFLIILITITLVDAPHVSAQAQSGVQLENVVASYRYGEQITFVAQINSSVPIQQASIVITDEANGVSQVQPLSIDPNGRAEYRLDARQSLLRPFSTVKWMYQLELANAETFQSTTYFLRYEDNRFDWQTLETGSLKVHWYAGDASFGQSALNVTQTGAEAIRSLMPLDLTQPIDIYIYASAEDLRGTLVLGGGDWVAGHADPALGVVMVAVEPGAEQGITMEQRIPHELMHVMMYRTLGAGYNNLPMWLREGAASLAETYPNPDYERALAKASSNNTLFPLKDLCTSFPVDAGPAFLAYAESRSFVNYLQGTYGSSGVLNLARSYADGLGCDDGTERTFGFSLANLEQKWRLSTLEQNRLLPVLQTISPYLVLLCLVLIIPFVGIIVTLRKPRGDHESGSSPKK